MRTLLTALALAPAALGLVACGGGDDDGGGGAAATFQQGQAIKVVGKEYSFDPGNVTIEGGGGQTEIEFENGGSLAHNLRLEKDGEDVGGSNTFTGGESQSFSVDVQPGEYEMICTVGDHADLGMTGKLTVK
jgi:plastocyanin